MTVELTSEAERLVAEQVASGAYPDASAVILAALSRLAEPEFDDALLDLLDEAEDDVDNGRVYALEDVRQRIHDAFTKE